MNQSILWWRLRSAAAQAWHYSAQSHSTSCSGPGYTQTSAGSSLVHWLIRDTGLLLLLLKMHLHCNSFSEVSADSTQGAAQWSTWNNFQLRKAKYFCVTSSNNFTELCVPNISKTLLSLQTALLSLVTVIADNFTGGWRRRVMILQTRDRNLLLQPLITPQLSPNVYFSVHPS